MSDRQTPPPPGGYPPPPGGYPPGQPPPGPESPTNVHPQYAPPGYQGTAAPTPPAYPPGYEPAAGSYGAATPPPTAPVQPGPRRGRLIAALVATVLVVAVAAGALFLANRGTTGTPSTVASYLPANALAYVELRLDRPGDQKDNLAEVLSKFPGFADKAQFEPKFDDMLDRVLGMATDNEVTYTNDVKPWFGGQAAAAFAAPAGQQQPPRGVVVLTITDRARAEAKLEELRAKTGGEATSEDYQGTRVWTSAGNASYAVTEDAIVLGPTAADVKAAIDAKGGRGQSLASNSAFTDAMEKIRGDRLGAFWMDTAGLRQVIETQMSGEGAPVPPAMLDQLRTAFRALPASFAGEIHAESDQFVAEFRGIDVPEESRPTTGTSKVAARLPAGALVYLEVHDLGRTLRQTFTQLKASASPEPGQTPATDQIEQLLGAKLEDAFGWATDAGLMVSFQGPLPSVALVALTTDEAAAEARLQALVAQVRQMSPEAVTETDHQGTKVTTINVAALTGGAAAGGPVPATLSYAIKEGAVLVGFGGGVVETMLGLEADRSLQNDPRFKAAVEAVGAETNGGLFYVDVTTIRQVVENFVPQDARQQYTQEIRPYVEHLDLLVAATIVEGEDVISRLVLTVK